MISWKLLGLLAALGTGYYFVEYKPAQDRKKKKGKKADTSTPQGMLYVGTTQQALEFVQGVISQQKPYFSVGVLRRGATYARFRPILVELLANYPEVVFVEIDFGKILGDMGKPVKSDVLLTGAAFSTSLEKSEGQCTFLTVSGSGADILTQNDEWMDADPGLGSCKDMDFSDHQAVVNRMVEMIENAIKLSTEQPLPQPVPPGEITFARGRVPIFGWLL